MKIIFQIIVYALVGMHVTDQGSSCSAEDKKNIQTFEQYKTCFKHTFHPSDEDKRRNNFHQNLGTVYSLRSKHPELKFGLNKYSHLSLEEFKAIYMGYKTEKELSPEFKKGNSHFTGIDWREKGVVAGIKNQRRCGSCYAFSAIGATESQYTIKTGNPILLSEQQVVDCSEDYGNNGCNGGLMDNVFQYLKDKGAMTSSQYPYVAKEGLCAYNETSYVLKLSGYKDIESGNEHALTEAIKTQGPIAVAIDAGHESFMFYQGGVYHEPNCSSTNLNHAVIAVGVSKKYYIVRNSWGKSWGEGGYVRMARNKNNLCGIATVASYPILA